jgi:tRNA1Val (adenine37-N6)-methyltransferase
LKNDCDRKSLARHTDSLTYADLAKGVARILQKEGRFCVVLPATEADTFQDYAREVGLYLNKILKLKPTPTKDCKRVLMEFSFCNTSLCEEVLVVEEFGRHQYSEAYKELTKDFYLAF